MERVIGPAGRVAALTAALVVGLATAVRAQVPTPIPSDLPNQVLNLIQRVTALEQKLAGLTNGTTTMRVRAPFQVVDAGGRPILQVIEGIGSGTANASILIAGAPSSGHAALTLLNKGGSPVVELDNLPPGTQGIAVYDHGGKLRAGIGLDGIIETWDEAGKAILVVAPDVKNREAALRLGKDEDGYALLVGPGEDVAKLGQDSDGFGLLTLGNGPKVGASVTGDGTLQLWNSSDKGILTVGEDVGDDDAEVRIGGMDDGYQITVGSENSATMGADGTVAGFGIYKAKKLLGGFATTESGTHLALVNGSGTTVVNLEVGQGGQGKFQLGNPDGSAAVEAGLSVDGVGMVQVYPKAKSLGAPGTIIKGAKK
jgi:hypothetical protein